MKVSNYARAFVFGLVLLASTMVPGQDVLGNNNWNNQLCINEVVVYFENENIVIKGGELHSKR